MDTVTIKYFLSVARCLNFSQAAEENHISQSSFSKAIMRLERDLGIKLIDRSSHPIALTPAGKCFYERMSELEPQFDAAINELEMLSKGKPLRVFICPKSYQYKLAFDEYLSNHKDVNLQVEETSELSIVAEQVRSGKYDFVISPLPFDVTDDIRVTTIYNDELYLLTSENSPFAERESISLKELDGMDFCESSYSKRLLAEVSRRYGFQPRKVYPAEGVEMRREECIHRITLNKGIGLYAGRDLAYYRAPLMYCVPVQEVPSLPVVLMERADSKDTPAKQRFRRWVLANLERFVPPRLAIEEFNRSVK